MGIAAYIDGIDERLAAEDDAHKVAGPVRIDAGAVFPECGPATNLAQLTARVLAAAEHPGAFYSAPTAGATDFAYRGNVLSFNSARPSGLAENDIVYADVKTRPHRKKAVLILRHWNAGDADYKSLAAAVAFAGATPVLVTLPYHARRKPPGAVLANDFLSANLGRTLASVRQAVVDVRCVIDWLAGIGYERFAIIGASLGACVASLVSIADTRIAASALLLIAGDFAEVVWTGRATRHIRTAFDGQITLRDLQSVWSILSPATFMAALARPGHRLMILSASRDRVVLPDYTRSFVRDLRAAGASLAQFEFSCGHYTLGMMPFGLFALARLIRFIRTDARV